MLQAFWSFKHSGIFHWKNAYHNTQTTLYLSYFTAKFQATIHYVTSTNQKMQLNLVHQEEEEFILHTWAQVEGFFLKFLVKLKVKFR